MTVAPHRLAPRRYAALALALSGCTGGSATLKDDTVAESVATADDSAAADDSTGGESGGPDSRADSGGDDSAADSGDSGDSGEVSPWAAACTSYASPTQTGLVVDETLDELSGLAVSRRDPDVLWVHEDHLGEPAIYALNTLGDTLATVTLEDATNNDWEDMAIGPCGDDWCVFLGEIGNNDADRTELGVYAFVEPDLATAVDGTITVTDWTWYGMSYPDENQNAEALAVTAEGLPVVLTKRYEDERSNVYIYPSLDAILPVTLTALGTLVTGADEEGPAAALTAADLWHDNSRLIYRTYGGVTEVDGSGGLDTLSTAIETEVAGAPEMHGEAIAYDPWRGGFWQVSEGVTPAIWFVSCGG